MAKVKDPVCGMMIDPARARFKGSYDGVEVYFCAESCQKAFETRKGRP